MTRIVDESCSIARSLGVLGERWTLLILRDAFEGITRFDEFRQSLGVAADVLSARLATLVEHGVMEKVDYREPGERRRAAYVLTDAGRELLVVIGALQQWGDRHVARPEGPSLLRRDARGRELRVAFVDPEGREVEPDDVAMVPTASYPPARLEARRAREERASAIPELTDRLREAPAR